MSPTLNVLSASLSSIRFFQKRIVSGSPSRSRGPGSSSRKKSASWASKERRPFGTILTGWLSEVGGGAVAEEPDVPEAGEGCTTGVAEGKPLSFFSVPYSWLTDCSARKC